MMQRGMANRLIFRPLVFDPTCKPFERGTACFEVPVGSASDSVGD
jgi:hypothetical protein